MLLERIHQVCNVKRPLSPQAADSEGGVNAQTVTVAWTPDMLYVMSLFFSKITVNTCQMVCFIIIILYYYILI